MSKPVHFDIEAFRRQAEAVRDRTHQQALTKVKTDEGRASIDYSNRLNAMRIEIACMQMEAANNGYEMPFAQALGSSVAQTIEAFSRSAGIETMSQYMLGYERAVRAMNGNTPAGSVYEEVNAAAMTGGNA